MIRWLWALVHRLYAVRARVDRWFDDPVIGHTEWAAIHATDDLHDRRLALLEEAVLRIERDSRERDVSTQKLRSAHDSRLADHATRLGILSDQLNAREALERRDEWIKHLAGCTPEQRAILDSVIAAMQSPHWETARRVVRDTAQTLGFNDPNAWVQYSRAVKKDPGQAENTFRHLKSVHDLRGEVGVLSNPQAHLLIELAYHGFAETGR